MKWVMDCASTVPKRTFFEMEFVLYPLELARFVGLDRGSIEMQE